MLDVLRGVAEEGTTTRSHHPCWYVNKSSDQTIFNWERDGVATDEVQRYVLGRYTRRSQTVR